MHALAGTPEFGAQPVLNLPLVSASEAIARNLIATEQLSAASLAMPRAPLGERAVLQVAMRVRDARAAFDPDSPLFGPSTGFISALSLTMVGVPRPVLTPRNTSSVVASRSQRLQLGPSAALCGQQAAKAPTGSKVALAFEWTAVASIESQILSLTPEDLVDAAATALVPRGDIPSYPDAVEVLTGVTG